MKHTGPRLDKRTINREFENQVRKVRFEEDYTIAQLAEKVGIGAGTIGQLEFGMVAPFIETKKGNHLKPWIVKLSKILKADLSYLFPMEICEIRRSELTYIQAVDFLVAEFSLNSNPEKNTISKNLRNKIFKILHELENRERLIILLRFYSEKSLDECSLIFKVTKERCRQIERKALSLLRRKLEKIR